MADKFNIRRLNKVKYRHINNKPFKEIFLYIITYRTTTTTNNNNNSNLWYRYLQLLTITRMRPHCIISHEHQRRELPKVLVLRYMYIYSFVSRYRRCSFSI
jgi:hypothetical protein